MPTILTSSTLGYIYNIHNKYRINSKQNIHNKKLMFNTRSQVNVQVHYEQEIY